MTLIICGAYLQVRITRKTKKECGLMVLLFLTVYSM